MDAQPADDLFAAIEAGDAARVDALLREQGTLANARNAGGITPLLTAVYYGKREIADLLLRAGAEVDLFAAAALGRTARLGALLREQSARVLTHSADGWTALHLAAFFGRERVAATLLDRGADVGAVAMNPLRVQPLHSAAAGGHTAVARLLLEHGADPNARQEGGFVPLHAAAQAGNEELYELLLASGADQDAATDDGRTAADFRADS
ncbi:MAG: ankyrin repeat domain-containing protein [Actinomycetota bacterium]